LELQSVCSKIQGNSEFFGNDLRCSRGIGQVAEVRIGGCP
jgi:hypothetical protein